jgi:hypothetical protein
MAAGIEFLLLQLESGKCSTSCRPGTPGAAPTATGTGKSNMVNQEQYGKGEKQILMVREFWRAASKN